MQFTTPVEIARENTLCAKDQVFMIGSCFADEMTSRMKERGIRVCSNPFGVQYNPLSIAACINRLLSGKEFEAADLFQSGGLYHSPLHHGAFSEPTEEATLAGINEALREGRKALLEANTIIITMGTAWVYEKEGEIVSNCHKRPSSTFTRRRLKSEEIATTFVTLLSNPTFNDKKLIFNVSPIRHKKDGLHENQLSKATLLIALEQLKEARNISYFPSYEILIDELRDYRFYASDMMHPSEQAVDYIWERFEETYFADSERKILHETESAYRALRHRPLHADTPEYISFREQALQRWETLKKQYPWLSDIRE